jgi:DNA invertase Pin-like site-specific DNA recombinase
MEMEEPYLRNSRHLHQAWAADGIGLFRCKFLMQNPGMIYGYASVSTIAQDLASQLARLKAAGCEKVFREKVTGTTADRPQLKKLMAALAPGDVVIIPAVDRLSRDTTDLMVIARDMQRAGAGLRSLAEPVLDTTGDFAELVLAMLGVAAKLERRRIAERTARGRAGAKAKGVRFGRKPKLTPHQQREARERVAAGETQRSVARSYNVDQATISRLTV